MNVADWLATVNRDYPNALADMLSRRQRHTFPKARQQKSPLVPMSKGYAWDGE